MVVKIIVCILFVICGIILDRMAIVARKTNGELVVNETDENTPRYFLYISDHINVTARTGKVVLKVISYEDFLNKEGLKRE